MKDFGDFSGERHEAVAGSFRYFGYTVKVNPALTPQDLVDWGEVASQIDEESAESLVAVKDMVRMFIHPDDFDTFWQAARENRQDMEEIMEVTRKISEAVTDRPTGRPTGSSDGQRPTEVSSVVASSLRAQQAAEEAGQGGLALIMKRRREALEAR